MWSNIWANAILKRFEFEINAELSVFKAMRPNVSKNPLLLNLNVYCVSSVESDAVCKALWSDISNHAPPQKSLLLNSKCVPSVESERLSERQNIPPLDSNEADRNTSKLLLQTRLNLLEINK